MILVDSSVWIDHFRNHNKILESLLFSGSVIIHEFIFGELAIGNFKNRKLIINLLDSIPKITKLNHSEFIFFINHHSLFGKGIGFVDVHLLGSSKMEGVKIWSLDKKLMKFATDMNIHFNR
jgi:predicted nucleic acid-binding protein